MSKVLTDFGECLKNCIRSSLEIPEKFENSKKIWKVWKSLKKFEKIRKNLKNSEKKNENRV